MIFVLNTRFLDTPASHVCIKYLQRLLVSHGFEATINDWENYAKYDIAIFMAYDPDIDKAKEQNPNILIGLADPKPNSIDDVKKVDFLMVSSIEQREIFYQYNPNIYIYYMFPEFDSFYVTHNRKDKVKIAYHGNIVHLNSFYKGITPALNELGKKYEIELHAVYNIKQFGKWSLGRPNKKRCKVYDLQWYENCYKDYFQDIDIGIVPNLTPIETGLFSKVVDRVIHIPSRYFFPVTHMDHHLDYKFSSNPGRIYVFSKFKIPVVTEASPSVSNLLSDNKSGKIVLSPHGWYHALEDLIQNPKKRKSLSDNLLKEIENFYSPEITFKKFLHFLKKIHKKKPPILKISSPYFTKELIAHIAWRIYKKASTIFYLNS